MSRRTPPQPRTEYPADPRRGGAGGARRRRWRPARLVRFGTLAEIAAGGGAKLSPAVDGDGRKPPPLN